MTSERAGSESSVGSAEAELEALRCSYADVLNSMGEGYVVLDADFRLLEINDEGVRIDGRAREELIGRTHWDLWPSSLGTAVEAAYREVMQSRQPLKLRHCFAGEGHDVWLDMRIHPVSRGVASFYKNVTQIVRSEEALRSSQERFRAAVDAIGVLWTNDASGQMSGPQPGWEQLTGQSQEQYQGYGWANAVHPDDAQSTVEAWEEAVRTRSVFVHEHRVRRCDGEWRKFSIRAVPVLEPEGVIREWVGVHIDVTEASAATEALRIADRRKDEFIATLAHELRNPLAPVRTAASMLTRRDLPPDKHLWCAQMIQRQVTTMAVLLDDLLDVSRITSGKLELRKEPVEAAQMIAAAAEVARPLLDRKQHVLDLEIAPSLPPVDADPVRLTQILANLLTNAAKYTDPQGLIRIRVDKFGDEVVFEVIDNGIGLTADSIKTLFEMFRQLGDAQHRSEGGLGIGLALTRGLVHLHGGSISVTSPGPGRGSTFAVRLPAAAAALSVSEETQAQQTTGKASGKTVLVVDDNVDAAQTLAALLELEGWRTLVAHDAPQAVKAAAETPPEVALLDIGLPGVSGYELATMLRSQAGDRRIRMAAISGWGQQGDKQRASAAGFARHFTKPVSPSELLRWLDEP